MTPPEPVEQPVVLVVDDEEGLADLYAVWLEDTALVETAYSGQAALDALNANVDVVLLDRRMPGLCGDQVLETLRDQGIDARVAIVSSVKPDVDILEMGFDAYLTKPVSRDELREAVDRMARRARYDEEMQDLLALISKRTTLADHVADIDFEQIDVDERDEPINLDARIEEQIEAADAIVSEFDERDFRVAFRDVETNRGLQPQSIDTT